MGFPSVRPGCGVAANFFRREWRKEAIPLETIHEVQRLLPSLSRGEKAQVLKWVVPDLGDEFTLLVSATFSAATKRAPTVREG